MTSTYAPLRVLADVTGISLPRLRLAASRREFPVVQLSPYRGRYYARVADVEAWLRQHTSPTPRPKPAPDLADLLPPGSDPDPRLM